jgi:hypothetical protein
MTVHCCGDCWFVAEDVPAAAMSLGGAVLTEALLHYG